MSDQSSIQWETATSKNGASFKVGREKTESVTEESTEAAATSKKDFGIAVNWPIVGTWTNTTDEVKARAAIVRYKLWESNAIGGKYTLEFTSTEHYNYNTISMMKLAILTESILSPMVTTPLNTTLTSQR